jgi:tRNA threonylcarbamoyl adenosine modification protein YeaZ
MIALGIELSSRQGSVALLKDGVALGEKTWLGERVRHNILFQTLDILLDETGVSYSDISLYAVGRGPGSFSGMRMAFAAAQALALPAKTEVRAVSSGAALAFQVAQTLFSEQNREGQTGVSVPQQIAVVGDARREQFWIGLFSAAAFHERGPRSRPSATVEQTGEWRLTPYKEVCFPAGTRIISSDAERLTSCFPTIGNARFPLASDVAALAVMQKIPEPLEPLYMHPPVFIEPKYN